MFKKNWAWQRGSASRQRVMPLRLLWGGAVQGGDLGHWGPDGSTMGMVRTEAPRAEKWVWEGRPMGLEQALGRDLGFTLQRTWGSGVERNGDCCCSATQSHLTLCNPMDCSMPGFPVLHHLPEFAQTHVHRIGDAIQPSHPLSSPSPPAFNLSQHQGLFQWVGSSHQSLGASVSESSLYKESFLFRAKTVTISTSNILLTSHQLILLPSTPFHPSLVALGNSSLTVRSHSKFPSSEKLPPAGRGDCSSLSSEELCPLCWTLLPLLKVTRREWAWRQTQPGPTPTAVWRGIFISSVVI